MDVIIPTFNRLWALPRVTESYLRRPHVRSVIVVDDGSCDGTREWIEARSRQEPRLLRLSHDRNRGAGAARNTGADAAQARLVFFADDDMVLDPADGLTQMARELDAQSAAIAAPVYIRREFASSLSSSLGAASGPPPLIFHRGTLELRPRHVLARCALPVSFETPLACGLMLMRREVLAKVRYDEELGANSYRDETDFQLKALREGFRLVACSGPVLIDLAPPRDNGGCHAAMTLAEYEWMACRNNWRILVRHRDVIRSRLGIRAPILYLQARFVAEHAGNRFARHYLGRALRGTGLLRELVARVCARVRG